MKKNYLRIILGILSPILVIGIVIFYISSDNYRVFMTGELSGEHSYVENNCETCHVPWKGVNNKSCLECHYDAKYEVKGDLAEIHGLSVKKTRCFDCHEEHRGRLHNINPVQNAAL